MPGTVPILESCGTITEVIPEEVIAAGTTRSTISNQVTIMLSYYNRGYALMVTTMLSCHD